MKTSSISQRVADFLKKYPPFQYIDEKDLLDLAKLGRVKFHETDEFIFEEGDKRTKWMYVIEHGTVRLLKNGPKGDELVDMRVEGDLLGVFWILGTEVHTHTAKTASDTLLYAIPWDEFVKVSKKYEEVSQYLARYFSLHPGSDEPGTESQNFPKELASAGGKWLDMSSQIDESRLSPCLTCSLDTPVRDVAKIISPSLQAGCIVVDGRQFPIGIITESDLSSRVATGEVSLDVSAKELMTSPIVTVPHDMSVGDMMLEMLDHRLRHMVVTEDGTMQSPVVALMDERYLQLFHGRLPFHMTKEIMVAQTVERLGHLRGRTDQLMEDYLGSGVSIEWLAEFLVQIDNHIVNRVIAMAEVEMLEEGIERPDVRFAWLAMHSEGRKERFLRSSQRTGIIYEDPGEEAAENCDKWFSALGEKVTDMLVGCGFPLDLRELMADNAKWCLPFSGWRKYFQEWIINPVDSDIIRRTPFFDMRVICGSEDLVSDLHDFIHGQLESSPTFMPLLANDAMANLPPVTIYRDSVMDQEGVLWTCIDTKLHALLPLVDTARVFALRYGIFHCTSTVERFENLAEILPSEKRLFKEAAQCMRICLGLQTAIGLRRGDNGQFIEPGELTKIEQEQIKRVFRLNLNLLEFTSSHFDLAKQGHIS